MNVRSRRSSIKKFRFGIGAVITAVVFLSGFLLNYSSNAEASNGASKSVTSLALPGANSGCPSRACSRVIASVTTGIKTNKLPSDLSPTLSAAATDLVVPTGLKCSLLPISSTERDYGPCVYPSQVTSTAPKVVLFGESHAWQWATSVASIASSSGFSFGLIYHTACFIALTDLQLGVDGGDLSDANDTPAGCHQWLEAAISWINGYNPKVVIVAAQPKWGGDPTFQKGLTEVLRALKAPGRDLVVIGGVPLLGQEGVGAACLAAHESDVQACGKSEPDAVDVHGINGEMAVAASVGALYINDVPWMCSTKTCPAVIGKYEVYQDQAHITSTYANFLGPVLEEALRPVGM